MCVYLVLHGDLGGQSVVSVPFLTEVEAQLLHFVLSLQMTPRLSCVSVAGARGSKLLQDNEGGNNHDQNETGRDNKGRIT